MKKSGFLVVLAVLLTMSVACKKKDSGVLDVANAQQSETAAIAGFGSQTTSAARGEQQNQVKMYEVPARLKDRPEKILRREGFTVSYNATTKTPNWVAWHLTKGHTYGKARRENQVFEEDREVAAPRATLNDYYNSRYDRGHMCPAGDNKWSEEAMNQSFLLTNVCPQNHGMNKNAWNDLEIQCRTWAREYGAVDIVCGPIFRGVSYEKGLIKPSSSQRFIGRNRVWVPDAFFKVVLCRGRSPKALGFIYENRGGQQTLADCVRSVDEIEQLTGIDFFYLLADDVENRVEAEAKLREWKR